MWLLVHLSPHLVPALSSLQAYLVRGEGGRGDRGGGGEGMVGRDSHLVTSTSFSSPAPSYVLPTSLSREG